MYDTATVTRHAVHADGNRDLLLLRHRHADLRRHHPGEHADGYADATAPCPTRSTDGPLTAGSYSFIGVYSGDSNYAGNIGAVEPLTINQGCSSVSTAINARHQQRPVPARWASRCTTRRR